MSAELLRQVFARPEDDGPRLVYADWLMEAGDERGRARGELIQLQHALGSIIKASHAGGVQYTHAKKPWPRAPDWDEKVARERALFQQLTSEWLAPVQRAAIEWTFRRGFIDRVTVDAAIVEDAQTLFEAEPVRSIWLRGELRPEEIEAFFALAFPASLRTLNLSLLALGTKGVQVIASAPHLGTVDHLVLMESELDDRAARVLADAPLLDGLRTLSLYGNPQITDEGYLALARGRGLPGLKVVRTRAKLKPETLAECSRRFTVVS